MDYHGRIINIDQAVGAACSSHYAIGHRDARHKAAEIALEAQAEIERLRDALDKYRQELDVVSKMLGTE